MSRDARGYGSDGNSYALDCYLDEQDKAEAISEQFTKDLIEQTDDLVLTLNELCEAYEAINKLTYGDAVILFSDRLDEFRGLIYGTYEEIETIANDLKGDYDFDVNQELKDIISKSVLATVSECE